MADYSIEVSIPNVGPQGPQGEVGPVGPANELTLGEITTGDAGTEAEATISGTPPNQVIDLVLPRGDTGAQGNPGPTGAGGVGVVPAPIYATMQEAVEDGITFGGVFRHTSGSVFWVEEPDPDAATFIAASGATDVWNIQQFVKGVKDLGLWDDMVCWPLRSAQNAGTGTTAYSLGGLGTFNGTLVNGPTWTADGIEFTQASAHHITTPLDVAGIRQFTALVDADPSTYVSLDCMFGAWGTTNYLGMRWAASTTIQTLIRSGAATRTGGAGSRSQDRRFYGMGTQGANTVFTESGAQVSSLAFVPDETGSQTLAIGILIPPNNSPFNGVIGSMLFFKDAELSTAQQLSVYNLYKQTLGTGLGLP